MKKENRLAQALGDVDDELLEKASPSQKRSVKRTKRTVWLSIAACFAVALGLWMFIPFNTKAPDVSKYAESEYYGIIQKLNAVTFVKPAFKNNFDKYVLNIFRGAAAEDAGASKDSASESIRYAEVTDNQVQGVIEADRIKRSTEHIFYLSGKTLTVYNILGENTSKIGEFTLSIGKNGDTSRRISLYTDKWDFFLSIDCKTVTVVAPYYDHGAKQTFVDVVSLDVSGLPTITEKGRVTVSGQYESARLVDGNLLLMTTFDVGRNPDFSNEAEFLPQIDDGNGKKSLAAADIIAPDVLSSAYYTVVCKLEESTLALLDSAAFLSYPGAIYVSPEEIFVTRAYTTEVEINGKLYDRTMTEIGRMDYSGEALVHKGSFHVNGSVLDQYSMDVYKGVLRVVTTTRDLLQAEKKNGDFIAYDIDVSRITNADLYCIDLASGLVLGSAISFAPQGETVQSARFDGDVAYVCTAVELTDPVFYFDLSDYANITYKESATITGYSSSLVELGDGYLLGIGVGSSWDSLKVEVYREGEQGVESVCKYELENVSFAHEYKSYFIDRENRLVGLGVTKNQKSSDARYILLCFDGYRLHELVNLPLEGNNAEKRAVLIDDHFYMFSTEEYLVKKLY
ncbi:MAG: beta-propeller domain-containing protein [Clostridia bacterium]|nr:beta-propeller domain-containing protein [Clostridia bacterium]